MPNTLTEEQQRSRDLEHLKLLGILFYVVGALAILFSSLGLIHVTLGIGMMLNPPKMQGHEPIPPQFFGLMFAVAGAFFVLTGWTMGALTIYAGRCIHMRSRRFFVLVIAGLLCMAYPFGTALGVATFFVLMRESVKNLFAS